MALLPNSAVTRPAFSQQGAGRGHNLFRSGLTNEVGGSLETVHNAAEAFSFPSLSFLFVSCCVVPFHFVSFDLSFLLACFH